MLSERDLKPGRARIKYENLLLKSAYVTKAEAEQQYHNQIDVVEAKYLFRSLCDHQRLSTHRLLMRT